MTIHFYDFSGKTKKESGFFFLHNTYSILGQVMKKPVVSFSHVETNPRVTVAWLIMDGQYERAAILSGLYGVNYEELVHECGVDDPKAMIMVRKVTN